MYKLLKATIEEQLKEKSIQGEAFDTRRNRQETDRINAQIAALNRRITELEEKVRRQDNAGTLTVEETDGTPIVQTVTRIQFDSAAGFTVSNPSPGIVIVTKTP